jgi:hypothetical protein
MDEDEMKFCVPIVEIETKKPAISIPLCIQVKEIRDIVDFIRNKEDQEKTLKETEKIFDWLLEQVKFEITKVKEKVM